MEVRSVNLPLTGFGAHPTSARVELWDLTLVDRIRRSATMFALCLLLALIAIPIPVVHFALAPAALMLGLVLGLARLRQQEIFRTAYGRCPFCGTEQSFTVLGRFSLPKKLDCASCHRQLVLEEPTTALPHFPTETRTRTRS